MNNSNAFGHWLKERRKSLDMTQVALGRLTGCSESSIRKIEAGTLKPSKQVAEMLATTLRVPEEEQADFVLWARAADGAAPPPRLLAATRSKTPARKNQGPPLPVPPTPLIGRETNVAEVLNIIDSQPSRLITLTGPPGTGKTRLALQVAADAGDQFEDGVRFVPLAPISDPTLVISTMSRLLGVGEEKGLSAVQALGQQLATKQILIVLDNFEQVIAAAHDIAELLSSVPNCVLLVTSREALHIRGEQVYPVPPLALPPDAISPEQLDELEEVPAIALFVQRARDTNPHFRLTKANASHVTEICRKLDGLPLAIELAAARISMFPPDALLERLESSLSVLTDGARDLPPRQRTIRNAIGSSYDLLDRDEQSLFRRLSVFRGGWTLEAAGHIAFVPSDPGAAGAASKHTEDASSLARANYAESEPHLIELLDSLRAKSLIRQFAQEGGPRFGMLEMIREYALEKLTQEGEENEAGHDHARYFSQMVEEAEPLIMGGKQTGTLEKLEIEHANLRAALTWSHSAGAGDEGLDMAAAMCAALSRFWLRRGHWAEGRRWIEDTLALLEQASEPSDERKARELKAKHARLLHRSGVIAYRQGDYLKANTQLRDSMSLWRQIDDKSKELAEVLQDAGTLAILRDEYGRATETLTEALNIQKVSENKQGSAQILTMLGFEAMAQGEYDRSNGLLHEALELFRELGDRWGVLRVQQHMAVVARNRGEFTLAQRLLDENLEGTRQLDNKGGIAASLGEMGLLALAQGDHVRAKALTEQVLEMYTALGGKSAGALAILTLGLVALHRGDQTEAEARSLEAMEIFHHEGARYDTASSIMALAGVASAQGQFRRAARLLGAAEEIFDSLGAKTDYFSRILQAQLTSRLRRQLGEPEFVLAQREGEAMSIDEAVVYAQQVSRQPEKRTNGAAKPVIAPQLSNA